MTAIRSFTSLKIATVLIVTKVVSLKAVVLVYSFNVRAANPIDNYAHHAARGGKKKWIQLKVYKDRIEQTISDEKIEFDNDMGAEALPDARSD